jgi:hypothetical protein
MINLVDEYCKKLIINRKKFFLSFLFFNLIFSNFCEDVFDAKFTITLHNQKKHLSNDKKNFSPFFIKGSLIFQHIHLFLIFHTFKWRQKTLSKTGRFKTAV